MPSALDIEQLDINEDSSALESVKGKRIGRLVVHIQGTRDPEYIAACKSVDHLELWSWREQDLTSISNLRVNYLRMIRGRQTSVKGLNTEWLKMVWLHACGKVRTLEIPRLPRLWLWASNNFNLDTLGAIDGLAILDIGMRKEINSLEFVARCRDLKCLSIDTYAWKTQNFKPLAEAPELELVGFTRLKPALIEEISASNTKLLVGSTGSNFFMKAGHRVDDDEYLKRRKAFNDQYGGE